MKHARPDYERFQDPMLMTRDEWMELYDCCMEETTSAIKRDEPVMLFRAKDKHFTKVLEEYGHLLIEDGAEPHMINAVIAHMVDAARWQEVNGSKSPDMPEVKA